METTNLSSMIFYESYITALTAAKVSPEDRCEFYEAIFLYHCQGIEPTFKNPILQAFFLAFRITIDNNRKKLLKHDEAVKNGKKGGAPRGNQNARKKPQTDTEQEKQPQIASAAPEPIEEQEDTSVKTTPETTISSYSSSSSSSSSNLSSKLSISISKEENNQNKGEEQKEKEKKKEKIKVNGKTLSERNVNFYNTLLGYVGTYSGHHVGTFYDYWSKLTPDKQHMRFEMQEAWDIESRLRRWKAN